MRTQIKICAITCPDDVKLSVRLGVDALGFVSENLSGVGLIADDRIAELTALVPSGIDSFLLTGFDDAREIISQQRRCGVTSVQLCRKVPAEDLMKLRNECRGLRLVQVVHVSNASAYGEALAAAPFVDALLLDSIASDNGVIQLGATGRVHDWELSRRIREAVPVPVYLAGGLTPANVAGAIAHVKPFGVDVCSGVRTEGRLDEKKLRALVAEVRRV